MDYFENAQIGGYRIDMPFPQLFYPEMNGTNKSYDQAGAPHMSGQQFQSEYYDGGCKPDLGHSRYGCNEDYPPRHSVTNSSFEYRSMSRNNRRAREMLARNGLYTPNDRCNKQQPEYPQFADDSIGQSVTVNSYWQ
ncbi:uncharacterized protein LOC135428141 [Drosophila montana]|uniref:uncharacterized protein LOC135428141 n=1 Tax=Drosophila montana TaxID=40370 RepID=UPI00313C26A9